MNKERLLFLLEIVKDVEEQAFKEQTIGSEHALVSAQKALVIALIDELANDEKIAA